MPLCALAQSTMTDEQVMQFVVEENQSGTSQAQIVTKLMQNGVDIDQIRRVRQKYERLAKTRAWARWVQTREPRTHACAQTTARTGGATRRKRMSATARSPRTG